jgi:arabinogalactan oligomer/maltooligosaccharide transport system permease protein
MSTPQSTISGQASSGAADGTPPVPPLPLTSDGSHARNFTRGFFAKLVLLGVIDALGVAIVNADRSEERRVGQEGM